MNSEEHISTDANGYVYNPADWIAVHDAIQLLRDVGIAEAPEELILDRLAAGLISSRAERLRGSGGKIDEIYEARYIARDFWTFLEKSEYKFNWKVGDFSKVRNSMRIELFNVHVFRSDVQQILRNLPNTTDLYDVSRRAGGLDYRDSDKTLLEEMKILISTGVCTSPHDAGLKLADRAKGRANPSSKAKRLAKLFKNTLGVQDRTT